MSVNTPSVKWLRTLFYLHIGLLAATCLSWLPIQDLWITWLKRVLLIGTALCLSQLTLKNSHYGKAALFCIIRIACLLTSSLFFSSPFIILAGAVFSILAVYQEYHAHAQMVEEKDAILSRKWASFFGWALLVEVLVSFVSSALSVATAMLHWDVFNITHFIMAVQSVPGLFVDVFYLIYMNRTVRLLEVEEGEVYG